MLHNLFSNSANNSVLQRERWYPSVLGVYFSKIFSTPQIKSRFYLTGRPTPLVFRPSTPATSYHFNQRLTDDRPASSKLATSDLVLPFNTSKTAFARRQRSLSRVLWIIFFNRRVSAPYKNAILFILNAFVWFIRFATDLIAQTALSSFHWVIYYLEQFFSSGRPKLGTWINSILVFTY